MLPEEYPMSILRQSPEFAKTVAATSVATLVEVIPPEVVTQAIERSHTRGKRRRKLPAELMAVAIVVLGLFAGGTLRYAVLKTLQGVRLRADFALGEPAGKGGICNARYRYGPRLLRELFTMICQPLATPNTPGAFLFGLRLLALDGTIELVADTPANAKAFGRWKGPRGPSAYPELKCIYLEECGTHAVVGALIRPCHASEQGAGRVLLKQSGPDSLLLLDSAHCCYQTIAQAQAQGVPILTRAKASLTLTPVQMLVDGTYLARMSPRNTKALRGKHGKLALLLVRRVPSGCRYDASDPKNPDRRIVHRLVTTLLDPLLYPAMTLIATYHERWEIENAIDEVDTHLRAERPILTSKKPAGVVQEIYGILLAHYAVRKVMFEAAQQIVVDPDRVSFVGALRLIRDALPELDAAATEQARARRSAVLLADVGKELNPPRRCRSYPRVVKRKMSKFKLKRPAAHGSQLKPTPFLDTVRIC
jgi:Insertion element 4 transposase N-terminal/Transposase DDE domain